MSMELRFEAKKTLLSTAFFTPVCMRLEFYCISCSAVQGTSLFGMCNFFSSFGKFVKSITEFVFEIIFHKFPKNQ